MEYQEYQDIENTGYYNNTNIWFLFLNPFNLCFFLIITGGLKQVLSY